MATTDATNVGVKNSWSLVEFARSHGKMKVTNDLVNSTDGTVFKTCAFEAPGTGAITLVGFSSKLDIDTTKTPKEIAMDIASQKDDLQVVQLESDRYKLCKRGTSSWETVDLGI